MKYRRCNARARPGPMQSSIRRLSAEVLLVGPLKMGDTRVITRMLLNWGLAMMSAPNPLGIPDITSFLKQVFGQAAFCFPTQNANLISALQTAFSLAEICWRNQNQWGDIRLAKLDSADARFADQAPTADLLRQAFEQGHSLVVADVQTKNGLFATLCRQLSRQFACPTRCSAYWSPSYSEGQALQYDDQDAFVVQVSGSNNWQVDFNNEFRPFGGEAYQSTRVEQCKTLKQLKLAVGDILYLPRGSCYKAATGSEQSLHFTFSVCSLRLRDLLLELLAPARPDLDLLRPALRAEDFSLAQGEDARAGLLGYLESLANRLRSEPELVDDALLAVHKNVAAQLAPLNLQLDRQLHRGDPVLTLDTRLAVNPEQYFVFDEPAQRVYFSGGDIHLPDGYRWVFNLLRHTDSFSPRDIISQYERADRQVELDSFAQLLTKNLLWLDRQTP
jgi:hypothetical protein